MRTGSQKLAARSIMQSMGYDPIEELVKIAQTPGTSNDTKIDIAQGMLPYMYPKLGAVEIETVGADDVVDVRRELAVRIMSDPVLSDAAHQLSIAAAEAAMDKEAAREERPRAIGSPLLG